MKKNISQEEIEIIEAIKASESFPEINWDEYLEETYAKYVLEMERKKNRQHRRRAILRRSAIAASIMVFLLVASALMSVLMPPPNAQAETWYEKILVSLRGVLRMETAPGVVENIDEPYITYQSIDDARAAGYTGYAPTYMPEEFVLAEIKLLQSSNSTYADYRIGNGESKVSIQYSWSANTQHDSIIPPENTAPFSWGDFIGYSVEYENGISMLACVSRNDYEMISASGDIMSGDLVLIIEGMKKVVNGG